jgi:phenylalanyl-tRNA synthetase alpha chain
MSESGNTPAAVEAEFDAALSEAQDLDEVQALRVSWLGRKGRVTGLLRSIASLPAVERGPFGQAVNDLKQRLGDRLDAREAELKARRRVAGLDAEWVDHSLDAGLPEPGHLHPVTRVMEEVIGIMTSMGFEVADGPEIETEYYNFDALNIPANHPARDVWDTFYLTSGEVPRTHTSSVQIRYMEQHAPPIRIIAPGRCFRYEAIDATHLAMFNQVEGLVVDRGIRLSDLKGTLATLAQKLLGDDVRTRLRPAYYPFVEPGVDMDITCIFCKGAGCRVCKGSGWIEVIPSGMVHPRVLRNCNIDPDVYSGFAFGMGFDRMVMLRYGIDDLRRLYDGHLHLVRQF